MGSIDTVTWQALTVVLTLVGLVSSGLLWRTRGPVAGLRMLAVALLPAAAYLTGTLRLLWEVGDALVTWATRLVFSPSVWAGVALAAVSLLIFLIAGRLAGRGVGGPRRSSGKELPAESSRKPARPTQEDDEMSDIEEILKRHGIT
ncbi:MAG TPA: hypothetical protein VLB29_17895 [Nocardioidaceae bacterium]|nr:hypothetical protein [Nocardioidaceae bacterium]